MVESSSFLMAALSWYPSLLSSWRTVSVDAGLFRCWFNSAVNLVAVVWFFFPTMCFNARRFPSVSVKVRPEFLWLLEFYCHGLWYGSSRKVEQFICFGDRGSSHTSSNNLPYCKLSYVTQFKIWVVWKIITNIQSSS